MRIALSKHQRWAALAAAAVILVVLWLQIQDEGFRGYGWVLALLAAAVLVIVGIGPVGSTTPAKVAAPAHVPRSKEELEAGWKKLRENAEVLAVEVEERAKILAKDFNASRSDLKLTNSDGTPWALEGALEGFVRERALLASLGLVGLRRTGKDRLYVTGIEYKTTEKSVFDLIARESIAALISAKMPVDKDKMLPQLLGELQAIRKTIVQGAEAATRGETDIERPLVEWLRAQGLTIKDNNIVKTALQG
jgi:hypothetical protein